MKVVLSEAIFQQPQNPVIIKAPKEAMCPKINMIVIYLNQNLKVEFDQCI